MHCTNELSIIYSVRRGHFQFKSGFQTFYTVIYRTPVRHDIAFKVPFIPQNFGEEPWVFRGENSIDAVIGTHNGFWLGLFDGSFKSRKIDLAKRAFIHV